MSEATQACNKRLELEEKIIAARNNKLETIIDIKSRSFRHVRELFDMRNAAIDGYFRAVGEAKNMYLDLFEGCNKKMKEFLGL